MSCSLASIVDFAKGIFCKEEEAIAEDIVEMLDSKMTGGVVKGLRRARTHPGSGWAVIAELSRTPYLKFFLTPKKVLSLACRMLESL